MEKGPDIIAHREFEEELRYVRDMAAYQTWRTAHVFPQLAARPRRAGRERPPDPIVPDILVGDRDHAFELGAVRFEVLNTPGAEGADNVSLWLPQQRILFTGDTTGFIVPGFPDIFTMRGEKIRRPMEYIRTLERFIALEPDMLVPSHHDPIVGRDNVLAGLRKVRDAVRYVHDAVVAGMNDGMTVHQVMAEVALPPELDLPQGHGKVSWAVKSIWEYYPPGSTSTARRSCIRCRRATSTGSWPTSSEPTRCWRGPGRISTAAGRCTRCTSSRWRSAAHRSMSGRCGSISKRTNG